MSCGLGGWFCSGSAFLVVGFGLLLVFWWWWALICGWFVMGFWDFFSLGFVAGGGFHGGGGVRDHTALVLKTIYVKISKF